MAANDAAGAADPLDDPKTELRLVERELTEARAEADELRRAIGDPAEEPGDMAARANLILSLETQQAIIETLEARATALRQQLGQS
jgi:hypothetical protein